MTMQTIPAALALTFDAVIFGVPAGVVIHAWRTRLHATHTLGAVIWRVVPPGAFVNLLATALLVRLIHATDTLDAYIPWGVSRTVELALFASVLTYIWRGIVRMAYPPQEAVR